MVLSRAVVGWGGGVVQSSGWVGWWCCPKQSLGGGGVVQSSSWVGWWFCPKLWLGGVVVLSKAVAG